MLFLVKCQKKLPIFIHLCTQVEIAEENCGLGAGDDQDDKDEEEEAVHVVDLTAPDAVQHKEELDEDATEGKHASHNYSRDWLKVKNEKNKDED